MASQTSEPVAVGIDFGTFNSCVGVFRNGNVEIVANAGGYRSTPSVVGFTPVEELVGTSASNQLLKNPENTVTGFKKLLGEAFGSVPLKDSHFDVVDHAGEHGVKVQLKGKEQVVSAKTLAAMVLRDLKNTAEAYLGQKVTEAVVAVPAYFSDAQRKAVIEASEASGMQVARLLNESTAAAIAYGADLSVEDGGKPGSKNVLVFDIGASTLEVAVINVQDGVFHVKAHTKSDEVGGDQLDEALVAHFVEEFEKANGINLRTAPGAKKAIHRMYKQCETAKQILAASGEAHIELDALYEGIDLFDSISAARFQILARKLFSEMNKPIREALAAAKLERGDIDEICLVGGCCKIPMVAEHVSKFFRGLKPLTSVDPDEAVAFGAAIQAGVLAGECDENREKLLVLDLAPLTIGVETANGLMAPIIPAGAIIPCSRTVTFSTSEHNQQSVFLSLHEGERLRAADNKTLGRFELAGIAPQPAGLPRIEVTLTLNADGVLSVSATDGTTSSDLTITNDKERATEADVKKAIADAEANAAADKEFRDNVKATAAFKAFLGGAYSRASKMNGKDRDEMTKMVEDAKAWLASQSPANASDCSEKEDAIEEAFEVIADRINNADDDLDLDDLDDLDDDDEDLD